MFDWMSANGLRGRVMLGYGMAHDDPRTASATECRYDACIEIPEGMAPAKFAELEPRRLPGGAYVRMRFVGPHSELGHAARKLREQWSAKHGMSICARRPLLEIYLDDPEFCQPQKLRTDVCLPVETVSGRNVA